MLVSTLGIGDIILYKITPYQKKNKLHTLKNQL